MNRLSLLLLMLVASFGLYSQDKFLGNYNNNPYDPDSVANPYGRYGNPYSADSINNPYGPYGNPYSDKSATNPYASEPPKLYDRYGNFKGNVTNDPLDLNSINNPNSIYHKDKLNPYGEYEIRGK